MEGWLRVEWALTADETNDERGQGKRHTSRRRIAPVNMVLTYAYVDRRQVSPVRGLMPLRDISALECLPRVAIVIQDVWPEKPWPCSDRGTNSKMVTAKTESPMSLQIHCWRLPVLAHECFTVKAASSRLSRARKCCKPAVFAPRRYPGLVLYSSSIPCDSFP